MWLFGMIRLTVIENFNQAVMTDPFFICRNLEVDQSLGVIAIADF